MKNLNAATDVAILCGGMGTRLREETETKPKPMVEIGGRPILWHIMKYYASYGFKKFILALGYKGEHIKKYFSNYNDEGEWDITCVDTGLRTLKGGRIKRLETHLKSEYFHLTYGDGLGRIDLDELTEFHLSSKKTGTVTAVRPPSRFGELLLEGSSVKEFEEKPQLSRGYINGGFFIFNKKLLEYLTPEEDCDLEFGALQKLAREGQLAAYKHEGYWQCMDTARDMNYLNELWKSGNPPWRIWDK